MADPGHAVRVDVSNDDITYNELDGINNVDWGPMADLLDTTDFKDTTGFKTRIQVLKDIAPTISGDYERTDTAQSALRTGWDTGATRYLKVMLDGTNGFKVACKVESFGISASVDGKVEFTASLQGTGAISVVP
jgi:predicted secreted protein